MSKTKIKNITKKIKDIDPMIETDGKDFKELEAILKSLKNPISKTAATVEKTELENNSNDDDSSDDDSNDDDSNNDDSNDDDSNDDDSNDDDSNDDDSNDDDSNTPPTPETPEILETNEMINLPEEERIQVKADTYEVLSSVSGRRGVLVPGESCKSCDFSGGEKTIKYLLEKKFIK